MNEVLKIETTADGKDFYCQWSFEHYRPDITDRDQWCAQVIEDFLDVQGFNKERVLDLLLNNRTVYTGSPENPYR